MSAEKVTPKWAEGLTHRERRFVEHYLVDLNATQAMVRCGKANQFDGRDYDSRKSAGVAAAQMLAKPHVAKAIEIALNEIGVTRVWIIDRFAKIANGKLADAMEIVGGRLRVKDTEEMDPETWALVSECYQEHDKDGNPTGIRIKLKDDSAALKQLSKLLRMEVERKEISGPNGGPIEIEEVDPVEDLMKSQDRIHKGLTESGNAPTPPVE